MRFIIYIITLYVFSATATAQIVFKIDELVVSSCYHDNSTCTTLTSDDWKGPFVAAKCLIINNAKNAIVFKPTVNSISFIFRHDSLDYQSGYSSFFSSYLSIEDTFFMRDYDVFGKEVVRPIKLVLNPKDTITLDFGTHPIIYTDIADKDYGIHYDFRNEMIEILPTIKVMYRDENIEICTDEILNVRHILPQKCPPE